MGIRFILRTSLAVIWVATGLGILQAQEPPLPDALQSQPKVKKLIEWGWDFPTPGYLRQNIRKMENAPFDGVNFWLIAGCNDPKSEGGTIFSKTKWDETKFEKIIINFNGTACPAYVKSAHDQYLFDNLGKPGTAVQNIPGVGINSKKAYD